MYDYPRYPPPYSANQAPYSAIDDPRLWMDAATRTGIPPIDVQAIGEERFIGQYMPPSLPSPGVPPVAPVYALVPYQARPAFHEPQQQRVLPPHSIPERGVGKEAASPPLVYVVFFCVVLAAILPAMFTTPVAPTHSQDQVLTRRLVRLNQWDGAQYSSPRDVETWGPSGCSAAAMTEVLNYYSEKTYRIADILSVEGDLGEITPRLGMLHGVSSISRTVSHFGFQATALASPTLDEVISTANGGKPVIVGFPPTTWEGGHVLLVRGGSVTTVYLTDSSRLNMPSMTRKTFLSYWRGFAVIIHPE